LGVNAGKNVTFFSYHKMSDFSNGTEPPEPQIMAHRRLLRAEKVYCVVAAVAAAVAVAVVAAAAVAQSALAT
jgi:hypothetical protein